MGALPDESSVGRDISPSQYNLVLQNLPGITEQEKFQHVLDIAPPWLLKFTKAPMTAFILKLKYPDCSRAPREGRRALLQSLSWPLLPLGTLQEGGPVRPYSRISLMTKSARSFGS